MRSLIVLMMIVSSFSVFAAEEKFTISHIVGNGYVYYNCDSVEDFTEDMLESLGATGISVRCRGGFDQYNPSWSTSARVVASFDVPEEGVMTSVELKGWQNCHLATTVFAAVSGNFDLQNVEVSRCSAFRPNGKYSISFDVAK